MRWPSDLRGRQRDRLRDDLRDGFVLVESLDRVDHRWGPALRIELIDGRVVELGLARERDARYACGLAPFRWCVVAALEWHADGSWWIELLTPDGYAAVAGWRIRVTTSTGGREHDAGERPRNPERRRTDGGAQEQLAQPADRRADGARSRLRDVR